MSGFDREWEKKLQFWKSEIDLFAKQLNDGGKLKSDTVEKHVSRILFVTEAYFMRYDIGYDEFDGGTVVDFLGNFYISKVLNSTKTELSAFLSSFKKWAQYLQRVGKISSTQYSDILRVCKNKEFFYERFDSYMDTDDDEDLMQDWFFADDLED
ncbi:hypothetical protein ACFQZT_27270 [Paenibacillus sp. GCM10027628]|uniref:hypothetical protein n=1 Tax=Paenibacillus sp. GCM10027628 TaxID=3273413 RepID=UPI003635D921